jgi:dihydrofolate reductase
MPCYVVTSRPLDAPSPWVVAWNGDLAGLVRHIRERHPKDIWLMGGGKLTKAFGEADLIDIWSIGFVPVFLGAGLPMFPSGVFGRRPVTLMATREYPSGVIQLRYERATSAKRRP